MAMTDKTFFDRIDTLAASSATVCFVSTGSSVTVEWAELVAASQTLADHPALADFEPGEIVMLAGETSPEIIVGLLACWRRRLIPTIAPRKSSLQTRGAFLTDLEGRLDQTHAAAVIAAESAQGELPTRGRLDIVRSRNASIGHLAVVRVRTRRVGAPRPGEWVAAQFSSGTSAAPRPRLIGERALTANLSGICQRLTLGHDDVFVSWLPLFHDMGLFAVVCLAMHCGGRLVLSPPRSFVEDPTSWMRTIAAHGGTYTAAPNFAYSIVGRAPVPARSAGLSTLRHVVSGSEQIVPRDVRQFLGAWSAWGMQPTSFVAAYGMAETVAATTVSPPGVGLECHLSDTASWTHSSVTRDGPARDLVEVPLVGEPIAGTHVRLVSGDGSAIAVDDVVGEIEVGGTSMAADLVSARPLGSEQGWWPTGDLGLMHSGRLGVVGRVSEMVILAGRNISPAAVEASLVGVRGVRPSRAAAFGVAGSRGTERLIVVAEVRAMEAYPGLRSRVRKAIEAAIGVSPEVVLLPEDTLVRTTSGKLRRQAYRRAYVEGKYDQFR